MLQYIDEYGFACSIRVNFINPTYVSYDVITFPRQTSSKYVETMILFIVCYSAKRHKPRALTLDYQTYRTLGMLY